MSRSLYFPLNRLQSFLSVLVFLAMPASASEFDVIINEVHYNALFQGRDTTDEFIELFNRGPTDVDLSGWRVTRGIDFLFPAGTIIDAGEYLVVSSSPESMKARLGIVAVGPWIGRLDNGGEVLEIVNEQGRLMNSIHYEDEQPWPSRADGKGPSLEYTRGDKSNDWPHLWRPSLSIGGTPGEQNSRFEEPIEIPVPDRQILVRINDPWRTFIGTREPSDPIDVWADPNFDDSIWAESAGGFGFGAGHGFSPGTPLQGMRGVYSSYYIRKSFDIDAELLQQLGDGSWELSLLVSYDDSFIAYLGGEELARRNIGEVGVPARFDDLADGSESATVAIPLASFLDLLETGGNVLAIQGANARLGNRDFFLGAELVATEALEPPDVEEGSGVYVGGIINEVKPTGGVPAPGFIELFNPTDDPLDLSGAALFSAEGLFFLVPNASVLAPGSRLTFSDAALGFDVPLADDTLVLVDSAGRVIDYLEIDPVGEGNSFGRFPDGNTEDDYSMSPSPGSSNSYSYETPVVISEIYFHPPYVAPDVDCDFRCSDASQWIEIFNRSDSEVVLSDWRITSGIRFDFPPGTTLAAGEYLVVAADITVFVAENPGVGNVLGDFSGRLKHSSETLNLRDPLGNRVDHVVYGDGGPINDLEPEDGENDGTVRVSSWPSEADGGGRTLELVHPWLNNNFGMSWRASNEAGGSPGRANSTEQASPRPSVDKVHHRPLVPGSGETVTISCRISTASEISLAEVIWEVDGGGASGSVELRDDGLSGDAVAGDRRYGARIPALAAGQIVRFRIRALDSSDRETIAPLQPGQIPYDGYQGHFYLYEVDDRPSPTNGSPVYRILLTARDARELGDRPETSDVLLAATFISQGGGGTKDSVHYHVGLRYRGENSRRLAIRSLRVDFPSENLLDGMEHLNLNASTGNRGASGVVEILANDVFRRAGQPYSMEWPSNVRLPGEVAGYFNPSFVRKENFDTDFLHRFFDGADDGNLYRARNPSFGGANANLEYIGEDFNDYREIYEKKSQREADDFNDVIALTKALDPTETPDDVFADTLEQFIDARQWAQFFAAMSCITNQDGGIWTNNGEDYLLYHVPGASSRSDAGKWLLLPWDMEETFRDSNERLFRPTVRTIVRFLSEPRFARLYYEELLNLRQGVFSRSEMRQRYGFVSRMFPPGDVFNVVDPIDAYVTRRLGFYDANIATGLTAGALNDISGEQIVGEGAEWRFHRGTSNPSGGPLDWTERNYSDGDWELGVSGFGYGDGDDATLLEDMEDNYATVFTRHRFAVTDPASVVSLALSMDYDDGFVAYFNGVEVARSNASDQVVSMDSRADGSHEASAGGFRGSEVELYDISSGLPELRPTGNVLAIVGLNVDPGSSDFSLIPELFVTRTDGQGVAIGCGSELFATGGSALIGGLAHPVETMSITVDHDLVPLEYITSGDGPYGIRWQTSVSLPGAESSLDIVTWSGAEGQGDLQESLELRVVRELGFFDILGDFDDDAVLTEEEGPYRVRGDIIVPAGSTLTIGPGTTLLLDFDSSLIIRGRILAEGTAEKPIEFRSLDCNVTWGGIAILGTGANIDDPLHVLRHCHFDGGSEPSNLNGCIAPVNARLLIEDSRFTNISSNAVDASSSRLDVVACVFEDIFEGVHCANSTTLVRDSTFRGMIGDTDAIDFDGEGEERSRIEGCLFEDGSDDGIDLGGVTVDIINNEFRRIQDKAISVERPGPLGQPTISGNIIFECGTGLAIKNGIDVQFGSHNTIVSCQEGINLFAKDDAPEGGHGTFDSIIVWNNVRNVMVDARSSVEISFSNIGGGSPWEGEGNISTPPAFRDARAGDLRLGPASPCIGSGFGGSDMGAIPADDIDPQITFLRGDGNESGAVDISDAIAILHYLFQGRSGPSCLDALDANDDAGIDISDPIYVLNFLFVAGDPIPAPYPEPGVDPTEDAILCE